MGELSAIIGMLSAMRWNDCPRSIGIPVRNRRNPHEHKVTSYAYGDKDTYVMYERGVGTSAFLDHWVGGTFGEGITNNIRRAYKFLSFHYELGDQIFIFGFSRGAYTARSLVGLLNAPGLLKRDCCTEALEQDVWDYYRSAPNDRLPGAWSALSPHINQRDKLRVACLGV